MKRYIRSNEEILKPFMVTFGWDTGGPDIGPRISSGHELVYALSKEDACLKWEADNAESFRPGGDLYVYEGCWAKPVTPEEVEEYKREEYERYAYEDDTIDSAYDITDYADGYAVFRDGKLSAVFNDLKDAKQSIRYEKAGDIEYGLGDHTYEIKEWRNGQLSPIN